MLADVACSHAQPFCRAPPSPSSVLAGAPSCPAPVIGFLSSLGPLSAHPQGESVPTASTIISPPMLYDYGGFPPEAYQVCGRHLLVLAFLMRGTPVTHSHTGHTVPVMGKSSA